MSLCSKGRTIRFGGGWGLGKYQKKLEQMFNHGKR